MATFRFERCDAEDPRRCQGLSHKGGSQCPFKSVEGSKYCGRHGGNAILKTRAAANQRLYLLNEWNDRFGRQADHPKIKGLREELGVLRMVLETRLNNCKDDDELLMRSGQITDMVREIAKTAKICHALEMSLNIVLDKAQAQAWITEISEIIGMYLTEPEILEMAAQDMMDSLERHTSMERTVPEERQLA